MGSRESSPLLDTSSVEKTGSRAMSSIPNSIPKLDDRSQAERVALMNSRLRCVQVFIIPGKAAQRLALLEPVLSAVQWMVVRNSNLRGTVNVDKWKNDAKDDSQTESSASKPRDPGFMMLEAQTKHAVNGVPTTRLRLLALYGCGALDTDGHKATYADLSKDERCVDCSKERRDCFRVERDDFYTESQCLQCMKYGILCSFTVG